MLVSIITASFNSKETIKRTIESILIQDYNNIEYIICDGGSTDETLKIIETYKSQFSDRGFALKVISEADDGLYHAMNKGIRMATGDLIGIINSDDWYENNTVSTIVNEHKKFGEGVYYGMLKIYRNSTLIQLRMNTIDNLDIQMIQHPTCFVSKEIYKKFGPFDLNYSVSADRDLMLRFKQKGVKFYGIEKTLANFTIGGISSNLGLEQMYEAVDISRKYGIISKTEAKQRKFNYKYGGYINKIAWLLVKPFFK